MSTDFRLHDLHTVSLVDPATDNITWTGAVHQFIDDNEFDADEREDIHAELSVNGVYRGGGGASPIWELYDRLLTPATSAPNFQRRIRA